VQGWKVLSELLDRILSVLTVGEAKSEGSAMALEELAAKVQAREEMVATEVNALVVDGTAVVIVVEGNPRVYLKGTADHAPVP
jgi:hypothetical protein